MFQMGKTNIKIYGVDHKISTRFENVAGQEPAKQEIQEFVDFLRNPERYNFNQISINWCTLATRSVTLGSSRDRKDPIGQSLCRRVGRALFLHLWK
jgi:hypothetical protein